MATGSTEGKESKQTNTKDSSNLTADNTPTLRSGTPTFESTGEHSHPSDGTTLTVDATQQAGRATMQDGTQFLEDTGPRTITMINTRIDTRRDLTDTGATISATGIKSILHRFQEASDYRIKGYDGQVTKAAGQGYAKIYNPATKRTDEMLFVYAPMISGTIISLEHHAKTHPDIHKWTQEATPSDDCGIITFLPQTAQWCRNILPCGVTGYITSKTYTSSQPHDRKKRSRIQWKNMSIPITDSWTRAGSLWLKYNAGPPRHPRPPLRTIPWKLTTLRISKRTTTALSSSLKSHPSAQSMLPLSHSRIAWRKKSTTTNYGTNAWAMHHWTASSGQLNTPTAYRILHQAIFLPSSDVAHAISPS